MAVRGRAGEESVTRAGRFCPGIYSQTDRNASERRSESGANLLTEAFLEELGERKHDVGWKCVVLLAKGEKEPAMLEYVQNRTEVPQRRNDESDVA
jgi:hypothetical protein